MKKTLLLMLTLTIIFLLSMSSFVGADIAEFADRFDLGGETVKLLALNQAPFSEFEDGQGLAWKEEVEEMFNVTFEFDTLHYSKQQDNLKTNVLAGGKPADILLWQFRAIHVRGPVYDFLLPLNDVIEDEYYDRLPNLGFVDPKDYTIAGVQYGVPRPGNLGSPIYWNKDLFEREGLPDLYELAENREWTWDKMIEIANAATRDTSGDGVIDQWGMPWYFDTGYGFVGHDMRLSLANEAPAIKFIDGRMVFNGTDPKFIEALEYMADEATNAPANYNEPDDFQTAFINGQVAMTHHPGNLEEMEDDWGLVPFPMGPSATDYRPTESIYGTWLIPITVENARAKIEAITALYRTAEPYIDKEEYAEEYWEEWAKEFGGGIRDKETLEWRKWITENVVAQNEVTIFRAGPDEILDTIRAAGRGDVGAVAAMDSIKPVAQAFLDDLFN